MASIAAATVSSAAPVRTRAGALVSLAIVALAAVIQGMGEQICDNSWLILFAERVYEGATPYADITDPNLPATWLVYMPAVILQKWTGLRAESFVFVEILALTFATGAFALRILRAARLDADVDVAAIRNFALFASLIVWGANFGQREHFTVLLMLPFLALCAARASGAAIGTGVAVVAGLLAAAAVCIKPFYALPLALPVVAAMIVRRSARPALGPEIFGAALATAVGYAATYKLTPAYFTLEMPQLTAVYLAGRYPLLEILTRPMVPYLLVTLGLLAHFIRRNRDPRVLMLTASAAGFLATFIIQGKMSYNHALPAIHLVVVAFGVEYARRRVQNPDAAALFLRRLATPVIALAPMFGLIHLNLLRMTPHAGVREAVERLAPAHPSIGGIVESFSIAFPMVRQVNGRWVGRASAIWGTDVGLYLLTLASTTPEHRRRIEDVIHSQRAWLAEDLSQGKPDVILVEDANVRRRELATSELARALDGYSHATDVKDVEIWLRDDLLAQGSKS